MSADDQGARGAYAVPAYQLPEGEAWYHFLHGNVPGHEIDFIYRAEVPQPPLTRQHFAHLTRLLRYIEPQAHESFAFAIGNLSRDDTQHEPGHGGMALIFMLRIQGATDHAGRQDPPFAHAVAAIDRELDEVTLIQTAVAFQRHVLVEQEAERWYRHYVRLAGGEPQVMRGMCESYLSHFADLPQAEPSELRVLWGTRGAQVPKRVVLAHDDEVSFGEIAVAAARIAAVLFRSDIRWTVITNGREDDIQGGVSVRLVARSHLLPADAAGVVHDLGDLPDDEEGIAHQLFGATALETKTNKQATGWRERFAAEAGERASAIMPESTSRRSWDGGPPPRVARPDPDGIDVTVSVPLRSASPLSEPPPSEGRVARMEVPPVLPFVPPPAPLPNLGPILPAEAAPVPLHAAHLGSDDAPRGSKRALWIILGGFCLALTVIAAVVVSFKDSTSGVPTSPSASAPAGPSAITSSMAAAPSTAHPGASTGPGASISAQPEASAQLDASVAPSATSKPSGSVKPPKKPPKKDGGGVIFDTP